jgi:hypothetical protein
MTEKVQSVLAKLIDIIEGASLFDTRLAASAGDLKILRRELGADRNTASEADFNAALTLVQISGNASARAAWLQEAKTAQAAIVKTKDDAIAALKKLEDKLTETQEQLARDRAAHEETIARERAAHERDLKAHQKRMAAEAAESTRLLNAAQTDAQAAANLRASLDARLENIRKVAAQ